MKLWKFVPAFLAIVLSASAMPALAGGGTDDPKPEKDKDKDSDTGMVSGEILAFALPGKESNGQGDVSPNIMLPGGYAYVGSYLWWGWANNWVEGQAKTWLDTNVQGSYNLCAQVVYVKKNSVNKGGSSWQCISGAAGSSKQVNKRVWEGAGNYFWESAGNHEVSGNGYYWAPGTYVSKQFP